MTLTERYLAELDREAKRTRKVLEHVPTGRDDWKPHQKSMAFGRLAGLVGEDFFGEREPGADFVGHLRFLDDNRTVLAFLPALLPALLP